MKIRTTQNFLLRSSMALAVMGTIHTPTSSWSAEPAEGEEMKMQSKTMEKCEEVKEEKQKMQMGKESMSKCPMMKEMAEKPAGDHSERHDKSE